MATVTSTLHPLPFQHLEPKRFEALVRALLYNFRNWSALEATGESGGDDGFDAIGRERLPVVRESSDSAGLEEDDETADDYRERVWLIQCKRELQIGPSSIVKHLESIPDSSFADLYGLVFVASAKLSKRARDAGRAYCARKGVNEIHFWGLPELEDALRQPANDHLLFAFFGISLQMRRQSVRTSLRRTIALKRKIKRLLSTPEWPGTEILLRDPSDSQYPYTEGTSLPQYPFEQSSLLWRPCLTLGLGLYGLRVIARLHRAFYDEVTGFWDVASGDSHPFLERSKDVWFGWPDQTSEAESLWWTLRRQCQVWMVVVVEIPFEDIIEIDDVGDELWALPTIFTHFADGRVALKGNVETYFFKHNQRFYSEPDKRIPVFSEQMRDAAWEARWRDAHQVQIATSLPPDLEIYWKPPDGAIQV